MASPASEELRIVCLTPCKNEAWILDRFLSCTSIWADDILLFDASTDNSREIAAKYPKVKIIEDNTGRYSEVTRQERLLRTAREIPGRKLLLTLDCDEIMNADAIDSPEWTTMKNAPPGTVFTFKLLNLKPDLQHYWIAPQRFAWGYMDDGAAHTGTLIHSTRIPIPAGAPRIDMNAIVFLHYQFVDRDRMKSKHRWYQCFERLQFPKKSAISIYRQYHHMNSITSEELEQVNLSWWKGYIDRGIDMSSVTIPGPYYWDAEVASFFRHHGTSQFWNVDVWDRNWKDDSGTNSAFTLPYFRRLCSRLLLKWLRATQKYQGTQPVRIADRLLSLFV